MADNRVTRYLRRLDDLKREKQPWLPHYESLGRIFSTRKADFMHAGSPGEFLQDDIFDNTPQFAAHVYGSVCQSMLWPDAARTFNIVPVPMLRGLPGVEAYFRAKTSRLHMSMDRPEAGLSLALMEHFTDQGIFGISGVATLEGPSEDASLPVVYEEWDVKTMFVSEGRQGFIDTVYLELERTVRQVYEEYGSGRPGDKVSAIIKEKYANNRFEEKVTILKVLEPKAPVAGKRGVLAMPWRTCHIDVANRTIMREGGYEEMPVAIARAFKRAGETQGRSCGMVALPAAINLNNLSEAIIVATEKQLDPPLGLLDDGRLGGAVVDTSAGALSVLNASGRMGGEKPIFPLFTVGEMQSSKDLKEQLIQEIMQAFFLDRLLDLNNKTMMTAYETSIRNRLRGESTGSLFARQIMEVIIPLIRRTYNIHLRRGYFGDFPGAEGAGKQERARWKKLTGKDEMAVPDAVMRAYEAGLDVYDIEFISPAQRFMQAEKLQGLMTSMDAKIAVSATHPEIMDGTDLDKWARAVDRYSGSPLEAQRTIEEIKAVRAAAAERQNMGAALEGGKVVSEIQRNSAQAQALIQRGA
jgi:hypothetical protein